MMARNSSEGRRTVVRMNLLLAVAAAIAVVLIVTAALVVMKSVAAPAVTLAASAGEAKVLNTIDDIQRSGRTYANVPAADGRMLRLLTEAAGAKHVVEIGTSTGISGLWFSLALEKTGGKLTTLELDARRAATARSHFSQAGVDHLIQLVEGNAHETLKQVTGPVDVAFIDAEKSGYLAYLEQLLPMVRPGGLILAHNSDMVPEYVSAVKKNPALETVIYSEGGGLVISLKKR
jgi:caffeoyl-CoA O-methyltransferase